MSGEYIKEPNRYMTQNKKKAVVNIGLQDEEMGANALKESFQKAELTAVKKFQEPKILVECDFIVEVSQSVATDGKHANYIEQLIRGMLEQNKNIRNIFDIDAFEPGMEGA
jgi:hypothetical protein